eukprot:jgi/Hompol1/5329/HPOL_004343-RA
MLRTTLHLTALRDHLINLRLREIVSMQNSLNDSQFMQTHSPQQNMQYSEYLEGSADSSASSSLTPPPMHYHPVANCTVSHPCTMASQPSLVHASTYYNSHPHYYYSNNNINNINNSNNINNGFYKSDHGIYTGYYNHHNPNNYYQAYHQPIPMHSFAHN